MRKQIFWDRDSVDLFIDKAMLSKEEIKIIDMYKERYTGKEMAKELKISTSTVSRRIKLLKEKYNRLIERGYDLPPLGYQEKE